MMLTGEQGKNSDILSAPWASTGTTRSLARHWQPVALALFVTAWIGLRIWCAFHFRVDSDEPQHLHIVWSWSQGLVQYRDFFDNHMPLFHLLCVPVLRMIGERDDVIVLMRLAMFPLYAGSLLCTYFIGRGLGSSRNGLWAAVLGGFLPLYFLMSLEYRADNLWSLLWLVAMTVIARSSLSCGRGFAVGLLLGLTLAVSLKTILLLAALGVGGLMAFALVERPARQRSAASLSLVLLAVLAGLVVAPAAVVAFFALQGCASNLWADAIAHNATATAGASATQMWRALLIAPGLAVLWVWGRRLRSCFGTQETASRALVIFLSNSVFVVLLLALWPKITSQDFLPVLPVLVLSLTPLVTGELVQLRAPGAPALGSVRKSAVVPIALVAVEFAAVLNVTKPWLDRMGPDQNELLREVLALTDSNQLIADGKGETVYRRRSTSYVLETLTLERFEQGTLRDDIPERLIATNTCVVNRIHFPPRASQFVEHHYIRVGRLRVVGQFLKVPRTRQALNFTVAILARYSFVGPSGPVDGVLDGTALNGPRDLEPGVHSFLPGRNERRVALIWTQAVERGFKPIWPRKPRS